MKLIFIFINASGYYNIIKHQISSNDQNKILIKQFHCVKITNQPQTWIHSCEENREKCGVCFRFYKMFYQTSEFLLAVNIYLF
jgi:hypothetical protein